MARLPRPPTDAFRRGRDGPHRRLTKLARMPLFGQVPEPELQRILPYLEAASATAGTTILDRRSPFRDLYIVTEGTAAVVDGDTFECYSSEPIALERLFNQPMAACPIVALTDVELVIVGARHIRPVCELAPALTYVLLRNHLARLGGQPPRP